MITGKRPVEAVARVRQDMLPPAAQAADRARYGADLLAAIDWALTPHEEKRPQSVAELRSSLPGFSSTSDQKTVKVEPFAPVSSPATMLPTGVVFDRETLKKIENELAKHIGPIAPVVIRAAAKKTYTVAGLADLVSADITDDKARAAFIKKFSGDKSMPTGDPTRATQSAPSNIDPRTLAKAEAALAKHIGAVAKIVVKRAAAKARDPGELYLLIAEEIEDKNERKAFVRKAISASGKD
jgi:hypothetical protein